MRTLFLAVLAYTGYRLALKIRDENGDEPLLLRDNRGKATQRGYSRSASKK